MLSARTRRDFLKLSAAGLAASAATESLPGWASVGSPNPASGEIAVRVTDEKRRFERAPALAWRPSSGQKPSGNAIALKPEEKFQEILGFGAAFTDASCYIFNQLSADAREQLFHDLFHPSELGLNVCRTCIGASDYSTELYSFDEGEPDPELKRFSIDHDRAYLLPSLRQARQANPDLFLFSTPWSPPGWMKANGSMLGGSMRKRFFPSYADYFVRFLQGYAAEGIKINAVTIQNEVDTDQDGRMPAALWGQEYEVEFVKKYLGPAFERASLDTKIWIIDHNYNLAGRAIDELNDAGLNKYVDGIAWHGYMGAPEAMTRVHDAFPAKNGYWTEGGPDITSPDYLT